MTEYKDKHCDKRDDFNGYILNSPFMCSNIPKTTTYGIYITQLLLHSNSKSLLINYCYIYTAVCDTGSATRLILDKVGQYLFSRIA
jgi:hypothetical protein